ncbi:MAG TPA: S-layer homology domain-containing protein [Acidimicrobiia bacterium]|nr:S-layer homology domain-containing protein [Acidimicrobiia bacterium]
MKNTRSIVGLALLVLVVAIPAAAAHRFNDVPDDNIFHDDISWLADAGITRGCNPPDNTEFCPSDNVTRQQMAAFLHRFGDYVSDSVAANEPGKLGRQLAQANLATAAYKDVEVAEADGWMSTLTTLGCFENPELGGMGVHYLNEGLLDDSVSAGSPEALVYELDNNGEIAALVAHEYIVPVDAWTSSEPPMLFGRHFHQHPVLPLWVLHAWVWEDNPSGMFEDWNPKVRQCPDGVPVFGVDLP